MKKKIYLLMMLFGISFMESCTKLEEQILDETTTTILNQKQAADGIIAPVYARLPDFFSHTVFLRLRKFQRTRLFCPTVAELIGAITGFISPCTNIPIKAQPPQLKKYLAFDSARNIKGDYGDECFTNQW
jgi:hypothetical protein